MKTFGLMIVLLLLLVFLVAFGPLAVVWALNSLFLLSIPFSLESWLAVVIIYCFLNAALNTNVKVKVSK